LSLLIIASVLLGIIVGKMGILAGFIQYIDLISTLALNLLLFSVGIELGRNKEIWQRLANYGWRIILIPLGVALGTLLGSAFISQAIDLPVNQALAVGAGFGWYSLSGVLLNELVSPELGTIAFLSNVFRELLAVIIIPLVALKFGSLTAVAPGGATSMDTTLPFVNKAAGADIALMAFISGATLTALVPILVPLFVNWPL
jgi:uncharacterized membrane protein YbjE (DUF340 family)